MSEAMQALTDLVGDGKSDGAVLAALREISDRLDAVESAATAPVADDPEEI